MAKDTAMDALFDKARREGLWFHCAYQDLWFSPADLEAQQERGCFRWGPVNWTLRDPQERVDDLRRKATRLIADAERVEKRIAR